MLYELLTINWFLFYDVNRIYIFNAVVDGYVARKFQQVSDFGAWLDVVADIVGRGILWCNVKHVSCY